MEIFSASYTDFIKFNKKPNEDFFLISSRYPLFAIADGVTQSLFENGKYAYPAGARVAAQIFCFSVIEYLENHLLSKKEVIKKAFDFANQRIWELNKNEGMVEKLDYDVYDLFDTVGIVGFLKNKKELFYGYVGDCGLAIFDKDNKLKFQTEDQVKKVKERVRKIYKNWDELSKREKTKIFHKEFRNNPSGFGYGSFSGEKGVRRYYQVGKRNLRKGELVVFYSDGFLEYLKFLEFLKILRKRDKNKLDEFTFKKARENYEKFGTDRTLISFSL